MITNICESKIIMCKLTSKLRKLSSEQGLTYALTIDICNI